MTNANHLPAELQRAMRAAHVDFAPITAAIASYLRTHAETMTWWHETLGLHGPDWSGDEYETIVAETGFRALFDAVDDVATVLTLFVADPLPERWAAWL